MSRSDDRIKRIFTEEGEIPDVVRRKKHEAYDMIYDRLNQEAEDNNEKKPEDGSDPGSDKENASSAREKRHKRSKWGIIPKAAVFLIAGIMLAGVSVMAKQFFKSRFERVNEMEQDEIAELREDFEHSANVYAAYSRNFTGSEMERMEELREAYKAKTKMPEQELPRLSEKEKYPGDGVYICRTQKGKENIVYLPDRELTDEELLEIIDYVDKMNFVAQDIIEENRQSEDFKYEDTGYHVKQFPEMTDEEVDYWYNTCGHGILDIQGFCREIDGEIHGANDNRNVLSEEEEALYKEMERQYYVEDRTPIKEITVITMPEEYSGEGVASCRYEGSIYIPSGEITEEDFLEIIDYYARLAYAFMRIDDEINLGIRDGFPEKEW